MTGRPPLSDLVGHDGFARDALHFVMAYVFRQVDRETGDLIGLLTHSIRLSYPAARVVLLTNELGRASISDPRIVVEVAVADSERVMVERMRAYRDYVRQVTPGAVIVFLDTDMLVMDRFDEIIEGEADLTVTVRPYRDMPINAGLIVARTDDHAKTCRFFDRLHDCCASLGEEEQRWFGDQVALARLLDAPSLRLKRSFIEPRGELAVRFAPSLVYNRTPRPWMLPLRFYWPGTKILHFKGARKHSMPRYAALHLSLRPRLRALFARR